MTLEEEIRNGESATLEFKERTPERYERCLKAVVVFANHRGARIVLGVDDGTGKIEAIGPEHPFESTEAITNAIPEGVSPNVEHRQVAGNELIVVDVPTGDVPPYRVGQSRPRACMRVGATTRMAHEETTRELLLMGSKRSFGQMVCLGLHVAPEDIDRLCQVMKEESGQLLPTNAYAVLSGNGPCSS